MCLLDVCVHTTCFFTSPTLKLLVSGQKLYFSPKNSMNLALFLIRTPPLPSPTRVPPLVKEHSIPAPKRNTHTALDCMQ